MNHNFLQNINKRQFEKTMKLEGQTVLNVSESKEEMVFFSKTRNTKNSQDKLSIFYKADGGIRKGNIIKYKNKYYIVINENYCENDVWRNSTLVKCNSVWNLFGTAVPLVASDLGSSSPSNGNFLSTVGGTFSLYTSDMQLLHEKVNIEDSFFDFGGVYKLVNKFFIDGLAYLYFQRDVLPLTEPTLNRVGNNLAFNLVDGSVKLVYYVGYNTGLADTNVFYVPNAKINYSVSDEAVATITEDGVLQFKSEGTVTVTTTSTVSLENGGEYNTYSISRSDTFTIGSGSPGGDPGSNPGGETDDVTWTVKQDLTTTTYCGSSYYNNFVIEPSEETDAVITWKIFLDGTEYTDPDITEYMEINTNTRYTYKFKVTSDTLVGYDIYVQAVANGVPVLTSSTTHVSS